MCVRRNYGGDKPMAGAKELSHASDFCTIEQVSEAAGAIRTDEDYTQEELDKAVKIEADIYEPFFLRELQDELWTRAKTWLCTELSSGDSYTDEGVVLGVPVRFHYQRVTGRSLRVMVESPIGQYEVHID